KVFRRLALVAEVRLERAHDLAAFDQTERAMAHVRQRSRQVQLLKSFGFGGSGRAETEIVRRQYHRVRQDTGAFDRVRQLANIPRPTMTLQSVHRLGSELGLTSAQLFSDLAREVTRE